MLPLFGFVLIHAYYVSAQCLGDCQALDPTLIQREGDGKYFRFSTAEGISIKTADSLEGPWDFEGIVLSRGSSIQIDGVDSERLWAPDVHYADGTYYIYYSISMWGESTSEIGVATSTTMDDGSWDDHGEIGVKSDDDSDYNAIDPNLIMIQGKPHLNFGSSFEGLQQVKMEDPLRKSPSSEPYQIAYNSSGDLQEGAYVFEHKDFYFLLFSVGHNIFPGETRLPEGDEYRIAVCRSDTGTGDFADAQGTPCTQDGGDTLLASHRHVYSPGGQGVFEDPRFGLVLYYHYADDDAGLDRANFQFGWNQLCFSDDDWPTICKREPQYPTSTSGGALSPTSTSGANSCRWHRGFSWLRRHRRP